MLVSLAGWRVDISLILCFYQYLSRAYNPQIRAFMAQKGFANITQLENFYFSKLQAIVKEVFGEDRGRRMIFWQEVFDHNQPVGSLQLPALDARKLPPCAGSHGNCAQLVLAQRSRAQSGHQTGRAKGIPSAGLLLLVGTQ
jgi:hypothetical protein